MVPVTNEFGGQEPGTDAQIKTFCTTNYKVTFPMLSKVTITGDQKVPLYKALTAQSPGEVKWNFEKFLIGRDGKVAARFKSDVEPNADELVKAIQAELAKKP